MADRGSGLGSFVGLVMSLMVFFLTDSRLSLPFLVPTSSLAIMGENMFFCGPPPLGVREVMVGFLGEFRGGSCEVIEWDRGLGRWGAKSPPPPPPMFVGVVLCLDSIPTCGGMGLGRNPILSLVSSDLVSWK